MDHIFEDEIQNLGSWPCPEGNSQFETTGPDERDCHMRVRGFAYLPRFEVAATAARRSRRRLSVTPILKGLFAT